MSKQVKTTEQLNLTSYQRGQLAHWRATAALPAKSETSHPDSAAAADPPSAPSLSLPQAERHIENLLQYLADEDQQTQQKGQPSPKDGPAEAQTTAPKQNDTKGEAAKANLSTTTPKPPANAKPPGQQ